MQIDINDTPATVALKLKIMELERENYILKMDAGLSPRRPVMTTIENLPSVDIDPGLQLFRVGSFNVQYDPSTGQRHAMGRCEYGSDRERVEYSYFLPGPHVLAKLGAEHAMVEMHKRMLFTFASKR